VLVSLFPVGVAINNDKNQKRKGDISDEF